MQKKVFVSGCFDLLHSGHIEFFQNAAAFGELHVAIGSDKTIYDLKGRPPINTEDERLFMIQSLACVKRAMISRGSGMLDFVNELREVGPDIFIVNEDGNTPDKEELCREYGIQYLILQREPHQGLTPRSSTGYRSIANIPYRIDLAGGWLDQPFLSSLHPGPVITISLEPTIEFNERSGMATSTRLKAIDLWGPRLPVNHPEKVAKILFCYDNPPGTKEISGSQDSIGIVFPGLNIAYYEGEYWPARIESVHDERILSFIEKSLYLIPLGPRQHTYRVLENTHITREGAQALAVAALSCWRAIVNCDIQGFGRYLRDSFEKQIAIFPDMLTGMMSQLIHQYRDQALGWKVSGAGGGGYLILVSEKPVENGIKVWIHRKDS